MRYGKLDTPELKEYIFDKLKCGRSEVVLSAAQGEDCAALKIGGFILVSSDPITCELPPEKLGALAVEVSCNDIAANGGDPVGLMFTVILPPNEKAETVGFIMEAAQRAAQKAGADIIGGHTEFSPSVRFPICAVTAIGVCARLMKKSDMKPGDLLFVTKSLALEAAAVLSEDCRDFLTTDELSEAEEYLKSLSVVPESRILRKFETVHAMHDVTEGGILGAVAEICLGAGLGAEIEEKRLPLNSAVKKICRLAGADPLKSLSSGAMLFAAEGLEAAQALRKAGISCNEIGRITERGVFLTGADGIRRSIGVEPDGIYSSLTRR